jgi:hypothetical protein
MDTSPGGNASYGSNYLDVRLAQSPGVGTAQSISLDTV